MYYDQYTQAIYNWLVNNQIADKITAIKTALDNIKAAMDILVPVGVTFLFLYFTFQFIRKRWLNV